MDGSDYSPESSHIKPQTKEERKLLPSWELLSRRTIDLIPAYRELVKSESDLPESRFKDLGTYSQESAFRVIAELDILKEILEGFKDGKYSDIVVNHRKILGDAQTFTLRFAPNGEKPGYGEENIQNQLSFHINVAGESIHEALEGMSLRGRDPHDVITSYLKHVNTQNLSVNSVGVYLDSITDRPRVIPQAGISFQWSRGQDKSHARGLSFVGGQPHYASLHGGNSLSAAEMAFIEKSVVTLTGSSKLTRQ